MNGDKEKRRDPSYVVTQTTRRVRVFSITEHEAQSLDQQRIMASAAFSFGTLCFGMVANMSMAPASFEWRLATVLRVVSVASWVFGAWVWRTKRSLLETIQRELEIESTLPDA